MSRSRTTPRVRPARPTLAILAGAAAAVTLAACSSSPAPGHSPSKGTGSGGGASSSPGYDAAIAALVPASLRSKGSLTVAANATYPPDEYFAADNRTIIGFDPDLAQAVGQVLGIKLAFVNAAFADIIPGLQAGHFDLGWSSATATAERQKQVNFVTYFNAGIGFLVPADSTLTIHGLADLCGHTLAVEAGSSEERTADAQNAKCTAGHQPAIQIQRYQNENQNLLALSSGRAQVSTAGSQIIPYLVQQAHGKFKSVGTTYNVAPLGVEIPKNTPIGLAKAIQQALNKMIADGSYRQILTKWGEQGGAIAQAQILPASAAS